LTKLIKIHELFFAEKLLDLEDALGLLHRADTITEKGYYFEVLWFIVNRNGFVGISAAIPVDSEVPLCSKIGEVFLPEFGGSANSRRSYLLFQVAQLHPADLTGNSLR
jgi:hypothetical protein